MVQPFARSFEKRGETINPIGPSIALLLKLVKHPKVVFSPIRSAPRKIDVMPTSVVKWLRASTLDGRDYEIPPGLTVISRLRQAVATARTMHWFVGLTANWNLTHPVFA
jgi:hypothetical protein